LFRPAEPIIQTKTLIMEILLIGMVLDELIGHRAFAAQSVKVNLPLDDAGHQRPAAATRHRHAKPGHAEL
jgi:hypothetical protein